MVSWTVIFLKSTLSFIATLLIDNGAVTFVSNTILSTGWELPSWAAGVVGSNSPSSRSESLPQFALSIQGPAVRALEDSIDDS